MKKYYFSLAITRVICAIFFPCTVIYAQDPLLSWNTFSDQSGAVENVVSVARSDDGSGIFITGTTETAGNTDVFTVALANDGSELWRHVYGSANDDLPEKIIYFDGFLYVCGLYNKPAGNANEYFLIKYAEDTGYLLDSVYTHFYKIQLFDMACNSNGDIYITGSSVHKLLYNESDIFTVAYSGNDLSELYSAYQFGNYAGTGKILLIDNADNVYVWGTIIDVIGGDKDCIMIKYAPDLTGPVVAIYESFAGKTDRAIDAEINSAGNYIYALAEGGDNTLTAEPHYAVYKIRTSTLARTWLKRRGTSIAGSDIPKDISINGNYIYVTGKSGTAEDMLTVAYRASGSLLWEATEDFGFADEGNALCYNNGDIYVAGYSSDNSLKIFRYEGTTGSYVWPSEFITYAGATDLSIPAGITTGSSSEIYIAASGENTLVNAASDYLLLKYDDAAPKLAHHISSQLIGAVYPNPATDQCFISFSGSANKIQCINLQGQVLVEENVSGLEQYHIDLSYYPAGLYQIKVYAGNSTDIRSFSVVK
ncbi:MAG: T9SS type A sorting domain-containing protein [Chitinophagales bacterium]|nr:T9SS type A sorting domain-containing protein [Chitinophagales bacterium]